MRVNDIINEIKNMDIKEDPIREIDDIGTVLVVKDKDLPYLMFIPKDLDNKERLAVEVNNLEVDSRSELLNQAISPLLKGMHIFKFQTPVLVPIIPSKENKPYYQQLSRDSFYEENPLHIEERVSNVIKDGLKKIETLKNVKLDDKVFMMGYSSSGVFAQRYALFHPEQIDTLVVGGASGSIPVPSSKIEYPLGIGGLPSFDSDSYSKIRFRYYVGEHETVNPAYDRHDVVDGKVVEAIRPMHDMTYFDRSVNPHTGKIYRDYFGEDYFKRVDKVVNLYKELGLDIESTIVKGKAHKNVNVDGVFYEGVKNREDPIIDNAYQESIASLKNEKRI